jgi:anti-sigma regulatory factor (Ser/Thr protein kinase)
LHEPAPDHAGSSGLSTSLDLRFRVGRASARKARHALDGLGSEVDTGLLDNLQLLVSELVTNSFRHAQLGAGGWIDLRVLVTAERVRVEVTDPGPGFDPNGVGPSIHQNAGWGLYLVGRIATRWGVDRNHLTRVWFEIDRRPGPAQNPSLTPRTGRG